MPSQYDRAGRSAWPPPRRPPSPRGAWASPSRHERTFHWPGGMSVPPGGGLQALPDLTFAQDLAQRAGNTGSIRDGEAAWRTAAATPWCQDAWKGKKVRNLKDFAPFHWLRRREPTARTGKAQSKQHVGVVHNSLCGVSGRENQTRVRMPTLSTLPAHLSTPPGYRRGHA